MSFVRSQSSLPPPLFLRFFFPFYSIALTSPITRAIHFKNSVANRGGTRSTRYCALMLDARITLAHFANSILACRTNSSGVLATGSKPSTARRCLDVRQRHDLYDLTMHESGDRFRRSGRNDDALPVVAHDVRIAGLGGRRQVRQRLRARLAGDREAAQLASITCCAAGDGEAKQIGVWPATSRRPRGPRC